MYEDGYENITNIDFSNKAISQMEDRCRSKYPKLIFKMMDVTDMKDFETGTFNTVIDKGTLDSIMCSDTPIPSSEKMISEIYRVLAPGGRYICITYGDPEHRKKYFENLQWSSLSVDKIAKPNSNNEENNDVNSKNFHYVYIMKK